jgi:hypothetical protein
MRITVYISHLYLRNGVVYIPTVARTEAGYFMDIDPVEVVSAADGDALRHAIKEAINKRNPTVPTPTRAAFPKPVVLKYAKVKSWSAFEKGTLPWTIEEKDGRYNIKPGRKRPDRGWEDDPERVESLPPGITLEAVADRVAYLMVLTAQNKRPSSL